MNLKMRNKQYRHGTVQKTSKSIDYQQNSPVAVIFILIFMVLSLFCLIKTLKNMKLMFDIFVMEYVIGEFIEWDD